MSGWQLGVARGGHRERGAIGRNGCRRWPARVLGSALVLAAAAALPVTPPAQSQTAPVPQFGGEAHGLRVVGHNDLGGQGLNGEVTVVGTTAVVGAGFTPQNIMELATNKTASLNVAPPCVTVPVKVVDLADPTRPRVASTIPVPEGQTARDVSALHVSTPAFTGDLLAIAFSTCKYDRRTYFERRISNPGSFAHRGVVYYDITDPDRPRTLSRYFADSENFDPTAPPCGPDAEGNCAKDLFSVELKRLRDGRIMSLTTTPQGVANNTASGDLRLVDVTDPAKPVQVGNWPPFGEAIPQASVNGCHPRNGGRSARFTPDGSRILLPYLDGGVYILDANNLSRPAVVGQFTYPADWTVEGQAAYVASAEVAGRQLTLVSEEDWYWMASALRIDTPADLAGLTTGCVDLQTNMDLKFQQQIYRQPGGQLSGEMVYVGRSCADRVSPTTGANVAADPYLADARGKIAVVEYGAAAVAPAVTGLNTTFCSGSSKVRVAQDNGARALVALRTVAAGTAESSAGMPALGTPIEATDEVFGATGQLTIPSLNIKQATTNALRQALCPSFDLVNRRCTGGRTVTGTLLDLPGEWGGLRVLDTTDPAAPKQVAEYRTTNARIFPPPDHRGIYSIHHAVVEGERAYAAWNSDGLRVLDLRSGGVPIEIASFVPPDRPDPTNTVPAKTYVQGVALTAGHIVISDVNSGLWVLEKPAPAGGRGHWLAGADGGVFAFGTADYYGGLGALKLNRPILAMAPTPTGNGYWLAAGDGGVFAFGDARYWGGMARARLNSPVVGIAATPSGRGYWLAAADGGVFAFGDARFLGSTASLALKKPVVGIGATPTGAGYRLAASDGGVFAFGDARYFGSAASVPLRSPVVGISVTRSGRGYWLAASDGGVFAFGDAPFSGSAATALPASPVAGMAAGAGTGYWLAGTDGGVFALGAPFLGSLATNRLSAPITAAAALPR
jgi:hypothetical protein